MIVEFFVEVVIGFFVLDYSIVVFGDCLEEVIDVVMIVEIVLLLVDCEVVLEDIDDFLGVIVEEFVVLFVLMMVIVMKN